MHIFLYIPSYFNYLPFHYVSHFFLTSIQFFLISSFTSIFTLSVTFFSFVKCHFFPTFVNKRCLLSILPYLKNKFNRIWYVVLQMISDIKKLFYYVDSFFSHINVIFLRLRSSEGQHIIHDWICFFMNYITNENMLFHLKKSRWPWNLKKYDFEKNFLLICVPSDRITFLCSIFPYHKKQWRYFKWSS